MQSGLKLLIVGLLVLAFLNAAEVIFAQTPVPLVLPPRSAGSLEEPGSVLIDPPQDNQSAGRAGSLAPGAGSAVPAKPLARLRGDAYYFALAQMYDAHGLDHARVLRRYAASGEPVPSEVIREEVAAIDGNMQAALKCYLKLSDKTRSDPKMATQLTMIEKHHQAILALSKKLDEAAQLEKEIEADAVAKQAGGIGAELRRAYAASVAAGGDQLQQEVSIPGPSSISDRPAD